jgi:hypothetical protein
MTTAAAIRPLSATFAAPRTASQRQRGHRLAAAAVLLAALSIPITGAGSALGATHAPAQSKVAAVADAVIGAVATGKHHV